MAESVKLSDQDPRDKLSVARTSDIDTGQSGLRITLIRHTTGETFEVVLPVDPTTIVLAKVRLKEPVS
jgi:hypothetical protein